MSLNTVGARIKHARELRKLTQDELAEKLHTHSTAVSKWERGINEPRGGTRLRIALALRVSTLWLKDGTGPMEAPAPYTAAEVLPPAPATSEAMMNLAIAATEETTAFLLEKGVALDQEQRMRLSTRVLQRCWDEGRPPIRQDVVEAFLAMMQE